MIHLNNLIPIATHKETRNHYYYPKSIFHEVTKPLKYLLKFLLPLFIMHSPKSSVYPALHVKQLLVPGPEQVKQEEWQFATKS